MPLLRSPHANTIRAAVNLDYDEVGRTSNLDALPGGQDPLGGDAARQSIDIPYREISRFAWLVVCSRGCCLQRVIAMVRFLLCLLIAVAIVATAAPADAQDRGRGSGRFSDPPLTLAPGRANQEPAFARGDSAAFRHA